MGEALDDKLLVPNYPGDKTPRYYQQIAINLAIEAILTGKRGVLLTLATGTGKTEIAFQIAWRLWNSNWNTRGLPQRRPRLLFLADRSFLVDDPKDKTFAPFGDTRQKIVRQAVKSREMCFATYQAIAQDESRPGLYRDYAPDFFDLIIVDEAHRGSARDDSSWREILEYFTGAVQLGMTATPSAPLGSGLLLSGLSALPLHSLAVLSGSAERRCAAHLDSAAQTNGDLSLSAAL